MNWYYLQDNEVIGPLSEAALKDLSKNQKITKESQICREGSESWESFEKVFPSKAEPMGEPIKPLKNRLRFLGAIAVVILIAGIIWKTTKQGDESEHATQTPQELQTEPTEEEILDYYRGIGFSEKEAEIYFDYFPKKHEPARAMLVLGGLYETRNLWNPDKVMFWHKKAAEAGSGKAMYRLHQILHPEFALAYRGYPKGNWEQSIYWAQKAAEQNDKDGLYAMGVLCWFGARDGYGDAFIHTPNKRDAAKWWRKASKAGSIEAEKRLEEHKHEISSLK